MIVGELGLGGRLGEAYAFVRFGFIVLGGGGFSVFYFFFYGSLVKILVLVLFVFLFLFFLFFVLIFGLPAAPEESEQSALLPGGFLLFLFFVFVLVFVRLLGLYGGTGIGLGLLGAALQFLERLSLLFLAQLAYAGEQFGGTAVAGNFIGFGGRGGRLRIFGGSGSLLCQKPSFPVRQYFFAA